MDDAWTAKNRLLDLGVPLEHALYVLPNAKALRLVESGSFLALQHKWTLRTCFNAQEEIYLASMDEIAQVRDLHPRLGRFLGPPCVLRNKVVSPRCTEGTHFCGVPVWNSFPTRCGDCSRSRAASSPRMSTPPRLDRAPLHRARGRHGAGGDAGGVRRRVPPGVPVAGAGRVHRLDRRRAGPRGQVKERLPWFDGATLDNLVDYLTYVFVPVLIMLRAGLCRPAVGDRGSAVAVLVASGYGFSRTDAKVATTDYFFTGFPMVLEHRRRCYLYVWRLLAGRPTPPSSRCWSCWCSCRSRYVYPVAHAHVAHRHAAARAHLGGLSPPW